MSRSTTLDSKYLPQTCMSRKTRIQHSPTSLAVLLSRLKQLWLSYFLSFFCFTAVLFLPMCLLAVGEMWAAMHTSINVCTPLLFPWIELFPVIYYSHPIGPYWEFTFMQLAFCYVSIPTCRYTSKAFPPSVAQALTELKQHLLSCRAGATLRILIKGCNDTVFLVTHGGEFVY